MPKQRLLTALPALDTADASPATSNVAMAALYRAALGPVQLPRYLALFERFDQAGRAPLGWNLNASLFTLNWMVLHHLWGAALVYLALVEGLALLVFGVGRPMLHWPTQVQCGLFTAFALFAFALPGLFGDALLHSEIRKRIQRVLGVAHTMPQACQMLARQASSQRRLGAIVLFNVVLFALLATTWALVPPGAWTGTSPVSTPVVSGKVQDATGAALPAPLAPRTVASAAAPAGAPSSASHLSEAPGTAPAPMPAPSPSGMPAPSDQAPPPTGDPTAPRQAGGDAPLPAASAPAPAPVPTAAPPSAPALAPAPAPAPKAAAEKAMPKASDKASKKAAEKPPDKKPPKARKKERVAPPPAAPVDTPPASLATVGSAPGYYLNVGLFAEVGNARRAQAKLLNAGLPAFRQTLGSAGAERTRLRVGPYRSQAEAQKAAAQVRHLGLEAVAFRQRGG